mgnify:CR=1 FL=1
MRRTPLSQRGALSGMSKKQKVQPEWEKNVALCAKVLKTIQKSPAAEIFLVPVDWKAFKLPTYPKIIKNPMETEFR